MVDEEVDGSNCTGKPTLPDSQSRCSQSDAMVREQTSLFFLQVGFYLYAPEKKPKRKDEGVETN